MRENYTLPRLYIAAKLSIGAEVELDAAQSRYLSAVIRKRVGDGVRLFNGADGEWRAEITAQDKRATTLSVGDQLRAPQAAPDIHLAFAVVRKHRTAFILEKGTELGASCFQPLITARTQFPKLNLERARAQIIEAAEQTERLDLPKLDAPQPLFDALPDDRAIIFADEAGEARPAAELMAGVSGAATLLIGPEGGFSDVERDQLRALPNVHPVTLGPRILRADTAALALLTLWQATNGDWGKTA